MTVNYLAGRGDFSRPEKEPRETKVSPTQVERFTESRAEANTWYLNSHKYFRHYFSKTGKVSKISDNLKEDGEQALVPPSSSHFL